MSPLLLRVMLIAVTSLATVLCQDDLESAPYRVVTRKTGYEIREYPSTMWVSTAATTSNIHDGASSGQLFWKLFRYIRGENDQGVEIPMTRPVTRKIFNQNNADGKMKYIMSFFLSSEFQSDTPVPTESGVIVEKRPPMVVAAITFGGFPEEKDFEEKTQELRSYLLRDGYERMPELFFTASYNGPAQLKNRRQEVWEVIQI